MDNQTNTSAQISSNAAPVKATKICLGITWALFLIPIVGTGFIAWPLNLAALILSIIVMAKGDSRRGVILLLCALIASPIIYFIGIGLMGLIFAGSAGAFGR